MAEASIRFPIIVGPTAGGKSALSIDVARRLHALTGRSAEVVTADSIQVYRGLDIGSAKPTRVEMAGIPHHLVDILDPTERFSVHAWLSMAEAVIDQVKGRNSIPVVVGGSHLYIKALLDGLFEGPAPDPKAREQLNARDLADLRDELERVDPAAAGRINAMDRRRTVRALEVHHATGRPISELQRQWDQDRPRRADAVLIGIEWPVPEINRRINARVRTMFERGLVEEARALWLGGLLGIQAREALGYKQLIDAFEGRGTLDEAHERIKIETRRFAKNQRTWLRRLKPTPGSVWIDAGVTPPEEWTLLVVRACLGGDVGG
ncbi:MAG: tRNA (adenosine(37)-N6)-dimethylallyltransferase MiaA [Phycisphaeraceae bacterium]|nr:tRNA (adenosine(37)-N6)-dimethylallyltransferase MiaA [Phycisphaerae bacterium]MBX3391242.1 tRNA (adenosine(37)-N6)-dimethylallyltransferase MiaA [Phycisphaeraceae bacterium]HRJ50318.1 tRNA (adenosine(37)-N6)-dimethylallyltransferase MiaA [Phycisphaerales bacterium]